MKTAKIKSTAPVVRAQQTIFVKLLSVTFLLGRPFFVHYILRRNCYGQSIGNSCECFRGTVLDWCSGASHGERIIRVQVSVRCRAEKDCEVYGFLMENYYRLQFSPAVEFSLREMRRSSKRRQKEAGRQTAAVGIGTKSQQALQMQREAVKTERRIISREQKEAEKQRQFELKQQKKREAQGQIALCTSLSF